MLINVNLLFSIAVRHSMVGIYPNRCLQLSVDGYLGCFQFLAVINNATRSIPIQISLCKRRRVSPGDSHERKIAEI